MNLVSGRRSPGRSVVLGFAIALFALLALAGRAQAAETLYWNNYGDNPDTVGFANIDGSGGGALNLAGVELDGPEGMAYDSVTNRIFIAADSSGPNGQIVQVNLDGSGASPFTAPGAPINEPEGITVDSATRTVYWINAKTGAESLSWARLDGSTGGVVNTAGASLVGAYRLAIDPVGGKLYWGTSTAGAGIQFAHVNNTGGGTLNITGAPVPSSIEGIVVDPTGGRVYWLDSSTIAFASLAGGGGGTVNLTGAPLNSPWGLAMDPSINRLYWGNESNGELRTNAFGFVGLAGGPGGINVATAPIANPQDPLIIKSPIGTGAPTLARNPKAPGELSCSQGTWGADYLGSFVYQAPRSFAYQWSRNGSAVPGATAAAFTATTPGSYACAVTATNQVGSAGQGSAAVNVKAAKVKLTTKRKAKVKAGGIATFRVKAVNQGDVKSKKARVCVKVSSKDLKAKPKCKTLGKVQGRGKDSAKLRIKVGESAKGTYKVTFQVKGSPGKAAKSKIVVR